MTPTFKKLNFKNHKEIVVLNMPDSFKAEVLEMSKEATLFYSIENLKKVEFIIVFVMKQTEIDLTAQAIAPLLEGDAVVWFAYPKGSSKKYKCDFNRDTGWEIFGKIGLEPVRQVAIDEDWSALRFRKVAFIDKMTRSFAMTEEGKAKVATAKK